MPEHIETSADSPLLVRSNLDGDVHCIALFGELDLDTSRTLRAELERVMRGDATRVVVDLSGLSFLDSEGLRALLEAAARSREDSGRLRFMRGRPEVQRVFEITGTEDSLPFAD